MVETKNKKEEENKGRTIGEAIEENIKKAKGFYEDLRDMGIEKEKAKGIVKRDYLAKQIIMERTIEKIEEF